MQGWAQDAQSFRLDKPLEDIQWVTREIVYILSSHGTLYRSKDSGRTWEDQSQKLDHAATTSKTGGAFLRVHVCGFYQLSGFLFCFLCMHGRLRLLFACVYVFSNLFCVACVLRVGVSQNEPTAPL